MESAIASSILKEKQAGRISLIPFLTSGYPTIQISEEIISELISENLVSAIEVGIPFSDPIAEGKTIQKSSSISLKNGVDIDSTLEMIDKINSYKQNKIPIITMGYYNPILKIGVENYFKSAKQASVQGLIIADIPNVELEKIQSIAKEYQIDTIPLVPLNSSHATVKHACSIAQGFVYCVSVLGVTGSRKNLSPRIKKKVESVKQYTNLPVAVGFGISSPEHIEFLSRFADAAIIGSSIIDIISDAKNENAVIEVKKFISILKKSSNINI